MSKTIKYVPHPAAGALSRYTVTVDGVEVGEVMQTIDIYPWARYKGWRAYLPDGSVLRNCRTRREAGLALALHAAEVPS